MKKKFLILSVVIGGLALFAAACNHSDDDSATDSISSSNVSSIVAGGDGILKQVRDRDSLKCGVRNDLPGFGTINPAGEFEGFDVDFCRVVAAAVLGDSNRVEFVPLATAERFTALQSGSIDILIRNTTWTATRDGAEAANFVYTTFYDGQGIMVPASSGITTLEGLQNATICVASGTTTETNLSSVFTQRNIDFNPLTFGQVTDLRSAYEAGQCEAWTADSSQLTAFKNSIESGNGPQQTILQEIISKEPLGPVVPDGDTEWAQVVRWAIMATIQAWEFGIDSSNIGTFLNLSAEENPNIAKFLGTDTGFNPRIGLDTDFAANIIRQVGNYKEIYENNILGLPLAGSVNDLWSNNGLLYTPPYR